MSTTTDYEYFKYSAMQAANASGEINLEGLKLPTVVRPHVVWRLTKKLGQLITAFFRAIANSIKETPGEYNARMARRYQDQPPVRGLW